MRLYPPSTHPESDRLYSCTKIGEGREGSALQRRIPEGIARASTKQSRGSGAKRDKTKSPFFSLGNGRKEGHLCRGSESYCTVNTNAHRMDGVGKWEGQESTQVGVIAQYACVRLPACVLGEREANDVHHRGKSEREFSCTPPQSKPFRQSPRLRTKSSSPAQTQSPHVNTSRKRNTSAGKSVAWTATAYARTDALSVEHLLASRRERRVVAANDPPALDPAPSSLPRP